MLIHSLRLFPHLQDTGGFYIAVLKKVATCSVKPERAKREEKVVEVMTEDPAPDDAEPKKNNQKGNNSNDAQAEEQKKKRGGGGGYPGAKGYEWKEDPFYPHKDGLADFYSLFGIDADVRSLLFFWHLILDSLNCVLNSSYG